MRTHFQSFVLLLLLGPMPMITMAQKSIGEVAIHSSKARKAFLLGNNDYIHIRPLQNPERDVDALQKALEGLGFQVYAYKNLSFSAAQQAFQRFVEGLSKDKTEVAWVYFSGHGLGVSGVNYLLPTNVSLCVEQLKTYEAMSLHRWIELLISKGIKHNFVFLDACRNLDGLTHCDGSTLTGPIQGLAKPLEKYRNLLIAFATTEGEVADDNTFDKFNSLFTAELLKHLPKPDIGIRDILDLTDKGVYSRSDSTQDPKRWDYLTENYIFTRTLPPPPTTNVISVVAYKPNGKDLDMYVAKLAVQQLKEKLPDHDVRLQTNSKGLSDNGIVCTVTRQTSIGTQQVVGDTLILAETQLKLTFKQGKELLDEIELSEGGTDNQEKIAIDNSIIRAFVHLKEQPINIQSANHQNNTTKR